MNLHAKRRVALCSVYRYGTTRLLPQPGDYRFSALARNLVYCVDGNRSEGYVLRKTVAINGRIGNSCVMDEFASPRLPSLISHWTLVIDIVVVQPSSRKAHTPSADLA